jgi:hypothetical protein
MSSRTLMRFSEPWSYCPWEAREIFSFDATAAHARHTHPSPTTLLGYVLVELGGDSPFTRLTQPLGGGKDLTLLDITICAYAGAAFWSRIALLFGPESHVNEGVALFETVTFSWWALCATMSQSARQRLSAELAVAERYLADVLQRYAGVDATYERFRERQALYGRDVDTCTIEMAAILWAARGSAAPAPLGALPEIDAAGHRLAAMVPSSCVSYLLESLASLHDGLAEGLRP